MKSFTLVLGFVFFTISVFSQEKFGQHTVSKGETLYQIAKKYGVKPNDLIAVNPDSKGILKLNSVLLIPNSTDNVSSEKEELIVKTITHEVLAKETLYGISKQYQTTVEAIKKENPFLEREGLKIGQKIEVPTSKVIAETKTVENNKFREEKVVAEKLVLKTSAPIVNEQEVKLDVVANQIISPNEKVLKRKEEVSLFSKEVVGTTATTEVNLDSKEEKTFIREVLPKETKYGIAKEFGISVIALEDQNPEIKSTLPVGYKLKITTNKKVKASEWSTPLPPDPNLKQSIALTVRDSSRISWNSNSDLLDQLVFTASDNIGTRYRSGGMSKDGFDCSGLMVTTFGSCDIQLPRTSIEQSQFGRKVELQEAQKGDLIFFKISNRKRINHVGMVVEVNDDEVKFIHASVHGGVMISSTKEPYYQKYFAQVNHVLD